MKIKSEYELLKIKLWLPVLYDETPLPLANVNVKLTKYFWLLLFSTVHMKTPPGMLLS